VPLSPKQKECWLPTQRSGPHYARASFPSTLFQPQREHQSQYFCLGVSSTLMTTIPSHSPNLHQLRPHSCKTDLCAVCPEFNQAHASLHWRILTHRNHNHTHQKHQDMPTKVTSTREMGHKSHISRITPHHLHHPQNQQSNRLDFRTTEYSAGA
jgi:hypothetical protein